MIDLISHEMQHTYTHTHIYKTLTRPPSRDEEKMSRQHVEVSSRLNVPGIVNRFTTALFFRLSTAPATVCLATRSPRFYTDNVLSSRRAKNSILFRGESSDRG